MSVIGINGDPTSSHVFVSKYLTGPGLGSSNNKSKRGKSWLCKCSTDNPFITINNERFEATYELIESSEKEYYWGLLDEVYPTFQMYRKRTNRDIPLIKFSKA